MSKTKVGTFLFCVLSLKNMNERHFISNIILIYTMYVFYYPTIKNMQGYENIQLDEDFTCVLPKFLKFFLGKLYTYISFQQKYLLFVV